VVENHADGTRMGIGIPIPKGERGTAETRGRAKTGSRTLRLERWRGIFGQPHERQPGFAAGSQGPVSVGKVGAKVRRVARIERKS